LELDVEPPKLKVLKKLLKMTKIDTDNKEETEKVFDDLIEALSIALSKNKQNRKVTVDEIDDLLDIDEIQDLLTAYFDWVNEINHSKN